MNDISNFDELMTQLEKKKAKTILRVVNSLVHSLQNSLTQELIYCIVISFVTSHNQEQTQRIK